MDDIKDNSWDSLDEYFSCLNEKTCYVILRNFESLDRDVLLLEHPDIDILCSDRDVMLSVSRSFPRGQKDDKVHRYIVVNKKRIDVDLRCVGDGYYDEKWEKDILNERILYNNRFYILSNDNYFYSLLYHVLIQKMKVSDDYLEKLERLSQAIHVKGDPIISISTLQSFMREKHYFFTYPESPYTIANFKHVDKTMVKNDIVRKYIRKKQQLRSSLINSIKRILLWEKK